MNLIMYNIVELLLVTLFVNNNIEQYILYFILAYICQLGIKKQFVPNIIEKYYSDEDYIT